MKLYYFVSCILAAGSLVVFPELSPAHGGGSGGHGGEVGVMDLGEEVLAVMDLAVMDSVGELLGVMVLAHPAQVSVGAAFGIQRDAWIYGSRFFWSSRSRSLR